MARGSSFKRVRDVSTSSLYSLLRPLSFPPLLRIDPEPFTDIEDRRRFHPLGNQAPAKDLLGRTNYKLQVPYALQRSRWPLSIPIGVQFVDADKVMLCVRRRVRREVLFAIKRAPLGLGRKHSWPFMKRKRWSHFSDVRC